MTPRDSLLLWTLRGHGRDVRCLCERARGAWELRVLWGDELFLTERFSAEEPLMERAREFCATLEARGWRHSGSAEKRRGAAPPPAGQPGPGAPAETGAIPAVDPGPGVLPETGAVPAPAEPAASRADRPAGAGEPAGLSHDAGSAGPARDSLLHPVVLVVDDEETIRHFLRSYLAAAGYQVREAEDVDAALALLDEGGVDAVVLDVRMPDRMGWGRTGLEVLAFMRLHAAYADLPVLLLTGHPLSDEELGLVHRHRAYLFMKPDGYRMLLARLNELTGHVPGSQN